MAIRHLKLLRLVDGQTVKMLHELTGIPVRTLQYRLRQLGEAGYIEVRREGRNLLYFKTPKGEGAARQRLDTVMVSSGRATWKDGSRIDATSCSTGVSSNNCLGLVDTLPTTDSDRAYILPDKSLLVTLVEQDVAPIASVQNVAPIPTLSPEEEEELENRERAALGLPPRSDSFYATVIRATMNARGT